MGDVALLGALLDGLCRAAGRTPPADARRGAGQGRRCRRCARSACADEGEHRPCRPAQGAGRAGPQGRAPSSRTCSRSPASRPSAGARPADIAERFLARAAERENPVNGDVKALLAQVLAIGGDPDGGLGVLRALADQASLDLGRRARRLRRAHRLPRRARRRCRQRSRFSAGFARNLDYYTGFIFELHDTARGDGKPVAGGGRYDKRARAPRRERRRCRPSAPRSGSIAWRETPHER